MANARTTPCATEAPYASSGRSARCQLNVPQPPREVRVHFATDSPGSSEDFTDAQALHHQHSRHFRPVCDRELTPSCGSSSSGREPQRGPSADPERGTRSSAVSDPPPGVVRGAFGSRRQIGYPKADGSPQRPSPAPLVKAQSFIISQFQREASVRIQHNRLGDEMVALRWSQFAETLVVQTLLPIFSLFWACARRTGVLRNVEMLPTQPMFYIQTLLFAIVVVAGVLYAEGISDSVINVPSVVTLSFEYLVLRAVTALKYGYLSPAAYAQWTGRHREGTLVPKPVPDIKRVREGMLAWMTAEKDHIDSEIKETATRLGIDLHACAFSIAAAHPSEPHSTMSPAHLQAAKKTLWTVSDVVADIVFEARSGRYVATKVLPVSLIFSLAHAVFTSGLGHAMVYNSFESDVPDGAIAALMVAVFLADFYMVFGLSAYGCAALVDYQHSYNALESLTQLCEYKSPSLATRDVMVPDAPPRISLLLSENVHLFLLTRRVLLHIGLRYRQRLQCFVSGTVMFMFGVAVFGVISGMGGSLESTVFMWHVVVDIGTMIVLLLACLYKGSATNQLTASHSALLDARALEVAAALGSVARKHRSRAPTFHHKMRRVVEEQLRDCERALNLVGKQLQHDLSLRAVKLVGVRATPAVMRTAVVFGATVISLVARVLLASGSGSSSVPGL